MSGKDPAGENGPIWRVIRLIPEGFARILDPSGHCQFVGGIEGVLENLEAGHEPSLDRESAAVGAVNGAEFRGDGLPVDGLCKADHLVVHVQGQL